MSKTTLLLLGEYMRFRQEEDFNNMYNCLENILDHNEANIFKKHPEKIKEIDNCMRWLWNNKDKWCIKDKETGNISKINLTNKKLIIDKFQETKRKMGRVLFEIGVTHKHKDDPAHAMRHFES